MFVSGIRANLKRFWLLIAGGLLSIVLNLFIFRFNDYFALRDFIALPYYYNLESNRSGISLFEGYFFNLLVDQGISPIEINSLFYVFFFSLGVVLSYVFLLRFKKLWFEGSESGQYEHLLAVLSSLLFVYNPFTLERFLMGQYNVLRGYLILIPVLYYFYHFIGTESKKNLEKHDLVVGVSLLVIVGIWSPHIVYMLVILSVIIVLISVVRIGKIKGIVQYLLSMVKPVLILVTVFLPGVIQQLVTGIQAGELSYYNNNIEQSATKDSIIQGFSLNFLGSEFPFIRALIGSGSWMSESISIETYQIGQRLGILKGMSLYYNEILSFLIILVLGLVICKIIYVYRGYGRSFQYSAIVGIVLMMTLTFGYYGVFAYVNHWFFELPFSYIMREPGKFYQMFIALVMILLTSGAYLCSKWIRSVLVSTLFVAVLGMIITFVPLAESLRYVEYPKIYKSIEMSCKPSDKVLYLPPDIYRIYEYTDPIASPRHTMNLVNCPLSDYDTNLITLNNGVIVNASEEDLQWVKLIKNPNQQLFDEFIKLSGVTIIVLDLFSNPDLQKIQKILDESQQFQQLLSEDSIFIYQKQTNSIDK